MTGIDISEVTTTILGGPAVDFLGYCMDCGQYVDSPRKYGCRCTRASGPKIKQPDIGQPLQSSSEALVQNSVLQAWVMALPRRYQGTLLTGIRGCDLAPKNPTSINARYGCSTGEDTAERMLTSYLRWCVMNPADDREVDIPGSFFSSKPPSNWKPSQLYHYPAHWFAHVMHCFEIIGYKHPHPSTRATAAAIYVRLVSSLHLNIETEEQLHQRLTEDRLANGTVVS